MKKTGMLSGSIDRYNEGVMTFEEREAFIGQMKEDVLLQTEVHLDRELNQFLSDPDAIEMMLKISRVTGRNRPLATGMKIFLVAASLVSVVSVASILYLVLQVQEKPLAETESWSIPVRTGIQTDKLVKDGQGQAGGGKIRNGSGVADNAKLMASAFEELPEFELLVGAIVRSAPVTMTSPAVQTCLRTGQALQFAWEGGGSQVIVKIYNNHGRLITSCAPHDRRQYTLRTLGFPAGLYYWKVFCGEELMKTGKIFILKHP